MKMFSTNSKISRTYSQTEMYDQEAFSTQDNSFAAALDFEEAQTYHRADGEFREHRVILIDGGEQFGVSTLSFDEQEELLWCGNQGGHVTSYLSADMMKYTSFQVHQREEIRDIQAINNGILIVTPTSLNMRTRQGMKVFTDELEDFKDLQCMLASNIDYERLFLGGLQPEIIEYNIETSQIISKYNVGEEGCVILREHPRFMCYGKTNGKIVLNDPLTMKEQHSFQAHSGTLSDFDVQGYYVATCGFSNRMGQMVGDQFVMVYDLRMMKMSLPLRAMVPPYYLRILPGLSSCLAAVSLLGQWVLMDAAQPESSLVSMNYQINCAPDSFMTSFEASSSGQSLAFGDSHGYLHLYTTGAKPVFNNFSQETEVPILEAPLHSIPITDTNTSFGCIPLYYPEEPLLSDWPAEFMQTPYWPTQPLDTDILQSMRMVGEVGYAHNSKNLKRNQFPYKPSSGGKKNSQLTDSGPQKGDEGPPPVSVPHRYRKIEIKYSKMGFDELDMDNYNRTSFPGLDMSLPNSYCNAMIQVFYYIAPLRTSILSHFCQKEFCLGCELSFLFHMLETNTGVGTPCFASNFLRAFRAIPEASAMSLTISDNDNRNRINFASKIQSWSCFVLQQIHADTVDLYSKEKDLSDKEYRTPVSSDTFNLTPSQEAEVPKSILMDSSDKFEKSPISDIFGSQVLSINKCTKCQDQTEKNVTSLTFNLSFHESAKELSEGSVPFSTVLEKSICSKQTTQAWCDTCSKYQPVEQFKKFKSLPNTIALNCGLDSAQDLKFWQTQHEFLLSSFQEKLKVERLNDEKILETSSPSRNVKGRPCRYGIACVRRGCHFWHPNRNKENADSINLLSIMDQTMEYAWVPHSLKVSLKPDGGLKIQNMAQDSKPSPSSEEPKEDDDIYELVGVVAHVADSRFPDKNNLISCIKVGPTYHKRAQVSPVAHWYLFNDISIFPITSEEAVWFPTWKTPCVLVWIKRTLPNKLVELKVNNPITSDVFIEDKSLAQKSRRRITFTPLTADEMLSEGDIIAMDAEFVNLHQEETELRSDGSKNTIKPSQKSVARITCIRCKGPLRGTPFMDDYISTQEQVVDYLTQFSGIKPGDLDANFSSKHLTTLKSTYVKLRYLIDKGVKIVGHGLKNDLKVININVPQNQLIDTVHLFHLPHNRMVSLKFLAWYFLKLKIQSVTHDSIEDAKTALALYLEYLKLSQVEGKLKLELQKMYEMGKKLQWKVPGVDKVDE